MCEWVEKRIKDIALVTMGQSPNSEFYNSDGLGMPFLQGNRTFGKKYPTFDTFTTSPNKTADKNDVIMSVRAPVGDLNITPVKMCLGRGVCSLRPKNGNYQFLYYLLHCNIPILLSRSNGTVYDSINRIDIEKMRVLVPKTNTQQTRIADILSAYDDAIENNNHRILLLEKAARELYREWFVRFRFPRYEKTRFVNGLPEGWEVRRLGELSGFRYGTMPDKNRVSDNGYPIFSGYRITGFYDEYMYSNEQLVLIARGVGGTGEVRISPRFCYLTNLSIAFILKDELYKFYLYERFQQQNLRELDTGAAQSQITINSLEQYKVILPPKLLMKQFDILGKAIYEEKQLLQSQSQNLAHQRDLLLPRLMSGKLEV